MADEAVKVLDSSTVQIALLGGGAFLLYQFWDTFGAASKLTKDITDATKDYIDDTAGLAPTFASLPEAIVGLAEGDDTAGQKMVSNLQDQADKGNEIAQIMIDLGGGIKPRVPYGDPPPNVDSGAYGDQVEPRLYRYRVWADATQIEDRDSLVSWSVAHKAAGLDPFKFAEKNLISFRDANNGQFLDIQWATDQLANMSDQLNADVRHTENRPGGGTNEWYTGAIKVFSNSDSYQNFPLLLKNDKDMSPMVGELNKPDSWIYFGLAGALDDAWADAKANGQRGWRLAKTDKAIREEVCEVLDGFELPMSYLEPMPNSSECQFLKYYGISYQLNPAEPTPAQAAVGWKGYLTFTC